MTDSCVPMNPVEASAAIRERSCRDFAGTLAVWEEGINLLIRSLDPLQGMPYRDPEHAKEPVQFALFAQAVNHQLAMYDLALDGFYFEALGLVRPCVERWLAWWYVEATPDDATRFLHMSETTPDWNAMLQAVERGNQDQFVRDWRKWLNKLAHVDRATLGMMWEPTNKENPLIRLGPVFSQELLEDCVGEAAAVIPPLLEIPDRMCLTYGLAPAEQDAATNYLARISAWMQDLERTRAEAGGAAESRS